MVRTYAFNPSTQSAGLPGSRTIPPEVNHVKYRKSEHDFNVSQHLNTSHSSSTVFPNPTNLEASLSSLSTISNETGSTPQIIPGSTQLFGVRSILINGQQFFQPIDPQLNYLINKEFAQLGLLKNDRQNSATPSDPVQSKKNSYDDQHHRSTMAAMQMANQHHMSLSHSHSNLSTIHETKPYQHYSETMPKPEKTFSEFDRAIQHNNVGLPLAYGMSKKTIPEKPMIDDLPWARGNPQPKSGKRGTASWNQGQRIAQIPASIYTDSDPYSSFNSAPPLPVHLPSLNMKADVNTYGSFYNDPISMARSAYMPSNNYHYSSSYNSFEYPKNDKEQHKMELLQQIEENKRRKEMEKLREKEIDDRERWRSEMFQARQQAEMDAERNAQREKAAVAERKALAIASMQNNHKKDHRSRTDSRDSYRPRAKEKYHDAVNGMSGPERKMEWWEKKNTYNEQRGKSPVIPALRNKMNNVRPDNQSYDGLETGKTELTPGPKSSSRASSTPPLRPESRPIKPAPRAPSRNSITSDTPPQFDRANESLRRLSQTERELEQEQQKLKSAIRKNQYDDRVFD